MPEQDWRSLDSEFELDRLIDSALATYAEPASNAQLAQCVLARVADERAHRRRPMWLPRAIAVPVAAGLLLLLVLSSSKPTRHPVEPANQAVLSPLPPSNHINASELPFTARSVPARRPRVSLPRQSEIAIKSKPLPRLDVFPTPQPLTPSEKALATYIAHTPEAERKALIDAQKQMDAPLSIAAIEIQPLEPPEEGGN